MSSAEPPGAGGDPGIATGEVLAVAGRVDALSDGVADAQAALRRLAAEPLPVGTGQDNAAIAAWYRELVDSDTAPAAAAVAADLDAVRTTLRRDVAGWEQNDRRGAASLGAEEPPSTG